MNPHPLPAAVELWARIEDSLTDRSLLDLRALDDELEWEIRGEQIKAIDAVLRGWMPR